MGWRALFTSQEAPEDDPQAGVGALEKVYLLQPFAKLVSSSYFVFSVTHNTHIHTSGFLFYMYMYLIISTIPFVLSLSLSAAVINMLSIRETATRLPLIKHLEVLELFQDKEYAHFIYVFLKHFYCLFTPDNGTV